MLFIFNEVRHVFDRSLVKLLAIIIVNICKQSFCTFFSFLKIILLFYWNIFICLQVRVDTGIVEGSTISMYYDPMISKVWCYRIHAVLINIKRDHDQDRLYLSGEAWGVGVGRKEKK